MYSRTKRALPPLVAGKGRILLILSLFAVKCSDKVSSGFEWAAGHCKH